MRSTDLFDHYLDGNLSSAEKHEFEQRLASDEVFAKAFEEHKQLRESLEEYDVAKKLRSKLQDIHEKEFGKDARVLPLEKENFARRYGKTVMIAASTALIAVLSTVAVLSAGGYLLKRHNDQILDLKKEVIGLKTSQDAIVEGIIEGAENVKNKVRYAPANFEGSAFAYNNNGYIVTSFHIVKGADSVFVQNTSLERTVARVVITDPALDLAVLKVESKEVVKGWQLPFGFSEKTAEIGEKVFTLGFPRKDMVYGEGSLSSLSGYSNDTTMYQISIPVNPGNSGGPLLDEQGNVIGVIRGKITNAEATGFAIKSREIIKAIKTLGADSIQATAAKKQAVKNLKRTEQIKRINPYVFNVLVYKN
jgi:S1-C subfamily serine protease